MKKLIFLGIFLIPFCLVQAQIPDSLKKAHTQLIMKASSFSSAYINRERYVGKIDKRIDQTEKIIQNLTEDTLGAKSRINIFRKDSLFYLEIIQKGDSLLKSLQGHDTVIMAQERGELADNFLLENEKEIDRVKWVIGYAKDTNAQVQKRLLNLYKEIKKMKDEAAKAKAKDEKKRKGR